MTTVVSIAFLISIIVYLYVGIFLSRKTKYVEDLLPLQLGKLSRVKNSTEFSRSTVATTISLATVIMAYFELAPYSHTLEYQPFSNRVFRGKMMEHAGRYQ